MIKLDSEIIKFLIQTSHSKHIHEKSFILFENGDLKIKEHTDFNTWDNVENYRNLMNGDVRYPVLDGLNDTWETIDHEYGSMNDNGDTGNEKRLIDRFDKPAKTPLEAFVYYVDSGFYPPPEILLAVKSCFDAYMSFKGRVELEEIFFGERKKGVGNFSAKESHNAIFDFMQFKESLNSIKSANNKQKKTQTELAEEVINKFYPSHNEPSELADLDSFLRSYRRWKKKRKG